MDLKKEEKKKSTRWGGGGDSKRFIFCSGVFEREGVDVCCGMCVQMLCREVVL